MTDDELAEFLGIANAKGRAKIMASLTEKDRATYEAMRKTEQDIKLWLEGVGPRPPGGILCRGHKHP